MWRRPELEVYLLKSNLNLLPALDQFWFGLTPVSLVNRFTLPRMHFAVDGARPTGAVHHQKIVVIDDAVAFCGGIDLTLGRWDRRDHARHDRGRSSAGHTYGPRHEVAAVVDDAAARVLAEQARQRWRDATGTELEPVTPVGPTWPRGLRPDVRDVDVAVARTLPSFGARAEVREVEALNLAAIAGARSVIYLENQYLASRRLADACSPAARTRRPRGRDRSAAQLGEPSRAGVHGQRPRATTAQAVESRRAQQIRRLLAGDHRWHACLRALEGDGDRRPTVADRLVESEQPIAGLRQRV